MLILNSRRADRAVAPDRLPHATRSILVSRGHDVPSRRRAARKRVILSIGVLALSALAFELAMILRLSH